MKEEPQQQGQPSAPAPAGEAKTEETCTFSPATTPQPGQSEAMTSYLIEEGMKNYDPLVEAGTHDGEATYEVSMASAGALSFVAF